MKEKIKKYWWVVIILLILGGAFYWFQWRPTQIRKGCSSYKPESFTKTILGKSYEQCLREHGLEK